MESAHWWVFDRPLRRDSLFLVAVLIGAVGVIVTLASADRYTALVLLLGVVLQIPYWLLIVGATLGSVREYWRARRRRRSATQG